MAGPLDDEAEGEGEEEHVVRPAQLSRNGNSFSLLRGRLVESLSVHCGALSGRFRPIRRRLGSVPRQIQPPRTHARRGRFVARMINGCPEMAAAMTRGSRHCQLRRAIY